MYFQHAPSFALQQTLLNFSPVHTSRCYVFERFNGYLGSYYTNNKANEPQITQRFIQHQEIYSFPIPPEIESIFHRQNTDTNSIATYSCNFLFLLHNAYDL